MLSEVATIVVPRLLSLMSAGQVNRVREAIGTETLSWAEPLEVSGVPNLYRVNANLYRSAQPTVAGFHRLEMLGIQSCMSLRSHCSDRADARGVGILCVWRPILGVNIAAEELEEIVLDLHFRLPKPVLVHCYQGADRTGLICAVYRILIENWAVEKAVQEMILGGFGYHRVYHPYVEILRNLDVAAMRKNIARYAALHTGKGQKQ